MFVCQWQTVNPSINCLILSKVFGNISKINWFFSSEAEGPSHFCPKEQITYPPWSSYFERIIRRIEPLNGGSTGFELKIQF